MPGFATNQFAFFFCFSSFHQIPDSSTCIAETGKSAILFVITKYHCRTFDFIGIANDVLRRRGVALPLEGQSTVSSDDRFEKGLAVQRSIFGERIDRMHEEAPENQVHIQRYLSADCFGDYYTRGGLDVKTRELLTFSMLVSLGGCESQVKGHIQGNANVGNGKATLLAVVTQLLPYIGYPRTLNAIACLNEVIPE